jgi:hypothetical protein
MEIIFGVFVLACIRYIIAGRGLMGKLVRECA